MNWLQRFMAGRYGSDQLNFALLVLCLLLSLISQITGLYVLLLISYLPLLFAIFRMFSRNIYKRRAENAWFLKLWTPVKMWFVQKFTMLRQSKQYRFFRCPSCRATVRVPRGKGKIQIRCPHCGNTFLKKS
ncbi:MAG: hypothetical protein PUA86_10245 [Clostridiaceae bacterium]|nr:hypothetical protein [Clostridiaceae bacterium]